MRRLLLLGLALSSLSSATVISSPAMAQGDLPRRRMGVAWEEGVPRVHFSVLDLADESVRETLQSGLPETLLMRIYAYTEGGSTIAVTARSCRVTRDVWEESYRVELQSAETDSTRTFTSLDQVLRHCLVVDRTAVGTRDQYVSRSGEQMYFAVLLEVNPLDPATVQRLRRWLSQPAGGGRVGGQAFFGSMVSLFVNRRIGSAQRTMRFRSQDARVP